MEWPLFFPVSMEDGMTRGNLYKLSILLLSTTLAACGGGGGGGNNDDDNNGGGGDTTPPTVVVAPAESGINPDAIITLNFSEAMDKATVEVTGSLAEAAADGIWLGNALTLTPESSWPENTTLRLIVGGKDIAGNALAAVTKDFTVNDVTAPTAIEGTGAAVNPYGDVKLIFSETMDPASLQMGHVLGSTDFDAAWSTTNVANDTLTLSPQTYWIGGLHRGLEFDIADLSGKGLSVSLPDLYVHLEFENNQAAEVAIGHTDLSGTFDSGDATLHQIISGTPTVHEGRLFVPDYQNSRILGYNTIPTESGAVADFVIGQENFTDTQTGLDQSSFGGWLPQLSANNETLLVTDSENDRVLVYSPLPETGPGAASVVVGQSDFVSAASACNNQSLESPYSAVIVNGRMLIADTSNHRVLIWNSIPTTNGASADLVLGQTSLDSCVANDPEGDGSTEINARGLMHPTAVWTDGEKVLVADHSNRRVLGWNNWPAENGQPADFVLGQQDFHLNTANDNDGDGMEDVTPGTSALYFPFLGLWSNGVQIVVADPGNHRILVWNNWPNQSGTTADRVLGQAGFMSSDLVATVEESNGATLGSPGGLTVYGPYLIVIDEWLNRAAVFRSNEDMD